MAAAIEGELKTKPALVRGVDGVFEVRANGATLFSKKKAGRFPTEAEVLGALRQLG